MVSRYLIVRLYLPILLLIIIFSVLAFYYPLKGFFVNLSTTLIGVLVVVGFVDYILKMYEKKKWSNVAIRIDRYVKRLAYMSISTVRFAFGPRIEISFKDTYEDADTTFDMHRMLIEHCEEILVPSIPDKVKLMTNVQWNKMLKDMESIYHYAEKIIDTYGDKLESNIYSNVFDIQDSSWNLLSLYSFFAKDYDLPPEKLPISKKVDKNLLEELSKNISLYLTDIVNSSANILKYYDERHAS